MTVVYGVAVACVLASLFLLARMLLRARGERAPWASRSRLRAIGISTLLMLVPLKVLAAPRMGDRALVVIAIALLGVGLTLLHLGQRAPK